MLPDMSIALPDLVSQIALGVLVTCIILLFIGVQFWRLATFGLIGRNRLALNAVDVSQRNDPDYIAMKRRESLRTHGLFSAGVIFLLLSRIIFHLSLTCLGVLCFFASAVNCSIVPLTKNQSARSGKRFMFNFFWLLQLPGFAVLGLVAVLMFLRPYYL